MRNFCCYRLSQFLILTFLMIFIMCHSDRVVHLFLVTKNESPILRSWILYHGNIVGFKNIYVIDSSSDKSAKSIVQSLKKTHQINLSYATDDLSVMAVKVSQNMRRSKHKSHFLMKIDTDEMLVLYLEKSRTISVNSSVIRQYFNKLPYEGMKYRYQLFAENVINPKCKANDDILLKTELFTSSKHSTFKPKYFYPSFSFNYTDLGCHGGKVDQIYEKKGYYQTNLGLIHYHNSCFEKRIELDMGALYSRKYISENDSIQKKIEKLKKLVGNWPKDCLHASCHKIYRIYHYLLDKTKSKNSYYQNLRNSTNQWYYPNIKNTLLYLHQKHDLVKSFKNNTVNQTLSNLVLYQQTINPPKGFHLFQDINTSHILKSKLVEHEYEHDVVPSKNKNNENHPHKKPASKSTKTVHINRNHKKGKTGV